MPTDIAPVRQVGFEIGGQVVRQVVPRVGRQIGRRHFTVRADDLAEHEVRAAVDGQGDQIADLHLLDERL